jgi:hypothetical protein
MCRFVAAMVAALLVVACSNSGPRRDCHTFANASLCSRELNPGHYPPEGSGLKPGSRVAIAISGEGLPTRGAMQTGVAAAAGSFPPERGATYGVVAPKGSAGVTVTITATSNAGTRIEASFRRDR